METFYLDPDYTNFEPGKSQLKYQPFYDAYTTDTREVLIFLVPVCMFLLLIYLPQLGRNIGLTLYGVMTTAEVEDCSKSTGTGSNKGINVSYRYTFENSSGNLVEYASQDTVINYALTCKDTPIGSTIQVQYHTDNPYKSLIHDERLRPPAVSSFLRNGINLLCIGLFPFITLLVIRSLLRVRQTFNHLQAHGILLTGEIVDCTADSSKSSNEAFQIKIKYKFTSPKNENLDGTQTMRRNDLKDKVLPIPGVPIKVLYADDHNFIML